MATLNDPDDPSGSLISGERVAGSEVFAPLGQKLGHIEDVMIDKASGRIAYAILRFGDFLGIGGRRHPLPWATLKYDPARGGYVVHLDPKTLHGAPAFAEDEQIAWDSEEWRRRIHDYYEAEPYWHSVPP